MNSANSTNNRIDSFDVMRIVAICAVILGHTSSDYVKSYSNNSLEYISNNLLNSYCRFAVPVFFMISGALMLNEYKQISNKKIIRAALNIFILLLVWNIFYSVTLCIIKPLAFKEDISIFSIVHTLFYGHYHMWYLFVLIGLYLMTPLLRTFIRRDNLPLITAYLNFSIVISFVLPFVNQMLNLYTVHENLLKNYISQYQLKYFYDGMIYYILGWYFLNAEIQKRTRITIYICGVLGFWATVICSQIYYDNTKGPINFFYDNNSLAVFLYSIAVFTFLHNLLMRKNFKANTTVLKLSSLVFGVYLIHPVFLFTLKNIFRNIGPAPLDTIAVFLGATPLSFFSVFVVSKIPIIKKMIRG